MPRSPELCDTLEIGAVDASASPNIQWVAPCDCVITGLGMTNGSAHAAHATDIATIVVTNVTKSDREIGRQTNDSDVTGYAAIVADTYWPLILSATLLNRECDQNDVVRIVFTEGGTATSGDLTECSFQIRYRRGHGVGYSA